jgi:hypothetical protein
MGIYTQPDDEHVKEGTATMVKEIVVEPCCLVEDCYPGPAPIMYNESCYEAALLLNGIIARRQGDDIDC